MERDSESDGNVPRIHPGRIRHTQSGGESGYNNTMEVSYQLLKKWVGAAWDQVSDLMDLRRLAQIITEVKMAASSTNGIKLYDEALIQVQALLGKDFEVAMTVTQIDSHQQI